MADLPNAGARRKAVAGFPSPGKSVFRKPWGPYGGLHTRGIAIIPPPAGTPQTVVNVSLGQMRTIPRGWGSKGYSFRRPFGPWGGLRTKGVFLTTAAQEVTDRNADKWYRQFTDPPAYMFKRGIPAALHPHFGFTQAATQMGGITFGEEVFVSSWYPPLSQPIIVHRDLARTPTAALPFAFRPAWPDISIGWFNPLAEPARFLPGAGKILQTGAQWTLGWNNNTEINLGWYHQLGQPLFEHPDLRRKYTTAHHQFEFREPETRDVRIGWFMGMNLPPGRFAKPYLPPALHVFYVSNPSNAPGRPFAKGYIIL